MFNYFRKRKLQKAFRSYLFQLGPELIKRYGAQDQYTVLQIQSTVNSLGLNTQYLAYAVALYRHAESENTLEILNINQEFLNHLRVEIGHSIFNGNQRYRTRDVLQLGKSTRWRGGAPPNWMSNNRGQSSL